MENRMGKAIKERRLTMGYTQQELGVKVGRTASQIGQIERGITKPSIDVLTRIVDVLSLDANMMFYERGISDELRDSMILLEQIEPERRKFIIDIIRMAYKQSQEVKEEQIENSRM